MATLFVIGDKLVGEHDYKEKIELGQIDDLFEAKAKNRHFSVSFNNVTVDTADLDISPNPITSYSPIGVGKPLSVEIMCIYTGDFITGFLAGRKRDILCVSGVKASNTFDATSRALNILEPKAKERQYLDFSALKACSPYVYYTMAVDTDSITVSFELDGNSYNEDLFATISDLLGKAAGIPLFMPAAGYLLAGSQLAKISAEGGNALFESSPFLSYSSTLRFATAGMPTNIARSFVICRGEHVPELQQYDAKAIDLNGDYKMRLIKNGNIYSGKAPYMIVNIDGAEKTGLESFAPTLASNSILKRFYGGSNKIEEASKILFDALSLYNDFTYKGKADKLKKRLDELSQQPESAEYKKAKALYDAYVANIQNDVFKPGD